MNCRLIPYAEHDGFLNMAIDEVLTLSCTGPVLRLYGWNPACVSLGYNQSVNEIDRGLCTTKHVDVVRRLTGGKAVFHDKELTYSFFVPENTGLVTDNVVESYKTISSALVFAFEKLGISVSLQEQVEKDATPNCFTSANWFELICEGKKLSGSAQKRTNGVVLQHGSLLLDMDFDFLALLFDQNNEEIRKKITSLRQCDHEVSVQEMSSALVEGFSEKLSLDMKEEPLTEQELKQATELVEKKYKTTEWLERR